MELRNQKNRQKQLVEESFVLRVGDFGKKLLWPQNQDKRNLPASIGEEEEPIGRSGSFVIRNGRETLAISFSINLAESMELEVEFGKDLTYSDGRINQVMTIETQELTFGTRWYFECSCGRRCNALYLAPGSCLFSCRTCQNLTYEICRVNKNIMGGLFYYSAKIIKLAEKKEKINRLFYNNQFTKKAKKYFLLEEKLDLGVDDEIKRFVELQIKLKAKENCN